MGGQVAAVMTNRVELCNVFRYCEKIRNGAEWLAPEIHIQPCYNHPVTTGRQLFTNKREAFVKELRFINPDHIYTSIHIQYFLRRKHGPGPDCARIVAYNFIRTVTGVAGRFEY